MDLEEHNKVNCNIKMTPSYSKGSGLEGRKAHLFLRFMEVLHNAIDCLPDGLLDLPSVQL